MKLVSIIVTTYNSAAVVSDALNSVLNQTYPHYEILVVDDCSSDETELRVKELVKQDERVKFFRLKQNSGGPARPRNYGVSKSSGTLICFMDPDDIWHREKLSVQLGLHERSGCSASSYRSLRFTSNATLENNFAALQIVSSTSSVKFEDIARKNVVVLSSVMIEKSLLLETRFNEDPGYHAVEDMDCWLRLLCKFDEWSIIESPLVGYRISPGQLSGNKIRMARKFWRVLSNICDSEGRGLGVRKYWYFLTYATISILQLLRSRAAKLGVG